MPARPNLVLITSDQQRADCLGLAGHPDLATPHLDALGRGGAHFRAAYTPCPICSPARRSLMTGRSPATDGATDLSPVRIPVPEETLPELLRRAGYQTAEIGRSMHQYPETARYGFEVREHSPYQSHDSRVHAAVPLTSKRGEFDNWPHLLNHGQPFCGYGARPWPYDEAFHQTTWTMNKAIEYVDRRDPEAPFFAHVGFVAPHPPSVPPACYYDRYANADLTPPAVGEWAEGPDGGAVGLSPLSGWIPLGEDRKSRQIRDSMAGYYGAIQHLDDMLFNLFYRLGMAETGPTYVLFCSDHGDMLGDHHMFRKCRPYEGAMRVPFLLHGPDVPSDTVVDAPVTLEDVLPTFCELAGVTVPGHVEGRSVMPLVRGEAGAARDFVHGEMANQYGMPGFHTLSSGREKYIWFSQSGREQLFDLTDDPRECRDRAGDKDAGPALRRWRDALTRTLKGRDEGFVQDDELVAGRDHAPVMRHAVRA